MKLLSAETAGNDDGTPNICRVYGTECAVGSPVPWNQATGQPFVIKKGCKSFRITVAVVIQFYHLHGNVCSNAKQLSSVTFESLQCRSCRTSNSVKEWRWQFNSFRMFPHISYIRTIVAWLTATRSVSVLAMFAIIFLLQASYSTTLTAE